MKLQFRSRLTNVKLQEFQLPTFKSKTHNLLNRNVTALNNKANDNNQLTVCLFVKITMMFESCIGN